MPQQNDHVEQKSQQILNYVRDLLIATSLPEQLWKEATLTSIYTINRTLSYALKYHSLNEHRYDFSSDYSHLRVFGSTCFLFLQPHKHSKLQSRSCLCCFLCYGIEHKGACCYDAISNCLHISKHVMFWKQKMFSNVLSFQIPYVL